MTTTKTKHRKPTSHKLTEPKPVKAGTTQFADGVRGLLETATGPISLPTHDSTEQAKVRQQVEGMRAKDGVEYQVEATADGKRVLVSKPDPSSPGQVTL